MREGRKADASGQTAACVIRAARDEDFPVCAAIKQSAAGLFGPDYRARPLALTSFLNFNNISCLMEILEIDSEAAGYCLAKTIGEDFFLHHLFVSPVYGRRGAGTALLHHVIAEAGRRGLAAVTLLTGAKAPWNAPFYGRHGFRALPREALPGYLAAGLVEDEENFAPHLDWVRNNPFILPRIAMKRDIA